MDRTPRRGAQFVVVGQRGPFLIVNTLVAVKRVVVDAVAALRAGGGWRPSERLGFRQVAVAVDEVAFLDDLVSCMPTNRPPGKLFTGRSKNKPM